MESIKRSEASPETPDKYDGGLYVGRAGIAYMLWFVGTKQPDLAHNLESARELALAHYRWRGFSRLCSSIFLRPGFACSKTTMIKRLVLDSCSAILGSMLVHLTAF